MRLKQSLCIALIVLLSGACTKSAHHDESSKDDMVKDDPNQALYDQVMTVHNEAMKTGEIFELKKQLKDLLASQPEKKMELEQTIALLDSADRSMMDWMHKFDEPDSVDQETAREYLENEMEKINKVKELTNSSIQKAKEQLGKK